MNTTKNSSSEIDSTVQAQAFKMAYDELGPVFVAAKYDLEKEIILLRSLADTTMTMDPVNNSVKEYRDIVNRLLQLEAEKQFFNTMINNEVNRIYSELMSQKPVEQKEEA